MMVNKTELETGDVVQLNENCNNPMLKYCFMTVTEPKAWGAQGYVQCTGENEKPGGQAYYRAKFEEMDLIGHTTLIAA